MLFFMVLFSFFMPNDYFHLAPKIHPERLKTARAYFVGYIDDNAGINHSSSEFEILKGIKKLESVDVDSFTILYYTIPLYNTITVCKGDYWNK
jgi:hypothetical protein